MSNAIIRTITIQNLIQYPRHSLPVALTKQLEAGDDTSVRGMRVMGIASANAAVYFDANAMTVVMR